MKKTLKKGSDMATKIGVGAVAAAALAMAGGYVLWEQMDKDKKTKVKAWVIKARKEAAQKVAMAKKMSEGEYKHIVDAAVERYGSMANVNKAELQKTAATLRAEWKRIQGQAKVLAKQMQAKNAGSKVSGAKKTATKKRKLAKKAAK